jgi:hypothetical protein
MKPASLAQSSAAIRKDRLSASAIFYLQEPYRRGYYAGLSEILQETL